MSPSATTQPRWASAPGATIVAILEDRGLSVEDLADRLELSDPDTRRLLRGDIAISAVTAERLERGLGGSADFWLRREAQYEESARLVGADEIARDVPSRQLEGFGWMSATGDWVSNAEAALTYFGVHDAQEWRQHWEPFFQRAHFRTSVAYQNKLAAVAAWLRRVELEAEQVQVEPWSVQRVRALLPELRRLTKVPDPERFYPQLRSLLATAGVAVIIAPAPTGCVLSGAAFKTASGVRVVALSARYLVDDHLWFTLFHELGHLVLHDDADVFLDALDASEEPSRVEGEADAFAQDVLLPGGYSADRPKPTRRQIHLLSSRLGVAPGILLGQLQHAGVIAYSSHNSLKRRYRWDGTTLKI